MPNFIDPRMQMPRGDGFAEQGGYRGQVYNSPPVQQPMAQPMQQPMRQPMPMQQPMRSMQDQAMRNQFGVGRMYPQLTPEDIEVFREFQRRQEMERELGQMYMQERMRGMLSE